MTLLSSLTTKNICSSFQKKIKKAKILENVVYIHYLNPSHPFLLCMHVFSVMSNSLQPNELEPAKLFCTWDSPGKNIVVLELAFPPPGQWLP